MGATFASFVVFVLLVSAAISVSVSDRLAGIYSRHVSSSLLSPASSTPNEATGFSLITAIKGAAARFRRRASVSGGNTSNTRGFQAGVVGYQAAAAQLASGKLAASMEQTAIADDAL